MSRSGLWATNTRRMLEEILALEEEHAEDMKSLMQSMGRDVPLSKGV